MSPRSPSPISALGHHSLYCYIGHVYLLCIAKDWAMDLAQLTTSLFPVALPLLFPTALAAAVTVSLSQPLIYQRVPIAGWSVGVWLPGR